MNLNLGCGEFYAEGWVNVDLDSPHRRDVTADVRDLPFEPGTVDRAYLGHVLEHLEYDDAQTALAGLRGLMVPGGAVLVVGPDIDRARANGADEQLIRDITEGGCRWDGDRHLWVCRESLVVGLLEAAGYRAVTPVDIYTIGPEWPVTVPTNWQCAVFATA